MDVLLYLCHHPHVVISAETLLDACWGNVAPSDNAIHKIITQLRRALDDSAGRTTLHRNHPQARLPPAGRAQL